MTTEESLPGADQRDARAEPTQDDPVAGAVIVEPNLRHLVEGAAPQLARALPAEEVHARWWAAITDVIRNWAIGRVASVAEFVDLVAAVISRSLLALRAPRLREVLIEVSRIGTDAVPILSMIAFMSGFTLAFQAGEQLREYGATIFVAEISGLALTRDLGPFVASILVAARSGSRIAAEIGMMKANQEIDALRAFAIDHVKVVVGPRVIATLICLPLLVLWTDLVGILGSFVTAITRLSLPADAYVSQLLQAVTPWHVLIGLTKGLIFAAIIAVVACHSGLRVTGGTREVADATTSAVVWSLVWLIAANLALTSFLYGIE